MGGFADVWKGQYQGQEVAVKVLRVYQDDDREKMKKVGCPRLVMCINELTVSDAEVLRGGCGMEGPPSS
jgi:hypothetical protein